MEVLTTLSHSLYRYVGTNYLLIWNTLFRSDHCLWYDTRPHLLIAADDYNRVCPRERQNKVQAAHWHHNDMHRIRNDQSLKQQLYVTQEERRERDRPKAWWPRIPGKDDVHEYTRERTQRIAYSIWLINMTNSRVMTPLTPLIWLQRRQNEKWLTKYTGKWQKLKFWLLSHLLCLLVCPQKDRSMSVQTINDVNRLRTYYHICKP